MPAAVRPASRRVHHRTGGGTLTERNPQDPHAGAPPAPVSDLSAAVLRISASLDVDTVLREVVESARAFTGARYGVIATVDEAGVAQGHIASGLTPEEAQQMAAWPDAMRLFAHLRALDGPLRLADLGAYVASLGLAPGLIACRTFCSRGSIGATGADLASVAGGVRVGSSEGIACPWGRCGRCRSVSLRAVGTVTRACGQRCHGVDKRR